jgi:hypothetical protein
LANFVYPSYVHEKLKHDALLLLGPWSINSRDVILVASVKRFAIQQVWERAVHMDVRYRLRRPLVDLVLHKYSTHSTRPGIISISE